MPRGMSYRESVVYRMQTTGMMGYFRSLISVVFSALMVAMISIIGDLKKHKKLSLLSYILILLVVSYIIGGHRIWIIALLVCLILSFKPYLKKRHVLLIILMAFLSTFLMSGAIRYSRSGESFTKNVEKFYEYSLKTKNMNFGELMWGWSSFNSPFSTFITIIKNIPQNINFDYSAYIKDFSLLIPKTIYSKRPLPYNEWYMKTFEPELFQKGAGKTFYVMGFGYLFAGYIGVLIHLFLFGALFEWLKKIFKMIGGAIGLFLYSYFFIQLIKFVVGTGFIAFIKTSILLDFLIPIILLFLSVLIIDSLNLKKFKHLDAEKYGLWMTYRAKVSTIEMSS